MRVSPAGLLAQSAAEALLLADRVTEVTHNHPEGMKGAEATALAIYLARQGMPPDKLRQRISTQFGYDLSRSVDAIRPGFKFYVTCQQTVPEALTCALEAASFEDAIRNAVSLGGDSDTLAAIAGSVAESLFGIPEAIAQQAKSYLPAEMLAVLDQLYNCAKTHSADTPTAPG